MVGFLFGGDTNETPESIKRKRDIVRALMGASAPKNIGEGINALGDGIVSAVLNDRANKAETAGRKSADSDFSALSGMFGGEAPASMPNPGAAAELSTSSPAATGGPTNYRDAIASIESAGSGDYAAVGPTHPKLGRALGRYQIMEANIGPWSQEALGRAVTPDEFMADPKLQDAIFDKKFGGYVEKFGPEGAAQAWIGGPGGVGKLDRKDSLGTSIGAYGQKFNRAIGANQQVASIDPAAGMTAAPPTPASAYVDPMVSAPNSQPQAPAAMASAQPAPQQQAELPPQQDMNALPALPPPVNVATPPVPPNAMPPQNQVAQALRQPPRSNNAELQAAQKVLSNQFSSEGQKAVAQALLRQEMSRRNAEEEMRLKQSDPAYQLGLEKDRLTIDQMRNPPPPSAVQELKMRAKAAGFEEGSKEYKDFMISGGKGPLVSVHTGDNSSKFNDESDKAAAGRLNDIVTAGNAAPQMMGDLQTLADLGRQIGTGKGAQITAAIGPYAAALGIDVKGLDETQAYNAIINRIAPQMRPAGSGATSDFDAKQFLSSLPSLGNQPGGNELILQTFSALQQNKIAAAEIAAKAQSGEIKWQDAEKQIRQLGNPYEAFKKLQAGTKPAPKATDEVPLDDLLKKYGG